MINISIIPKGGYLDKYSLSFTAAALMPFETKEVATLFLKEENWDNVKEIVIRENIIQRNSESSRKRIYSELKKRISNLSSNQLFFLSKATGTDLKHIVFLACIKTYKIILDFAIEVLYSKAIYYDYQLFDSDYNKFIESKKLDYEKLNTISSKTEYKIKQVLFKILEDTGLINSTKDKLITPPILTDEFIKLVLNDNPLYLKAFLLSEGDINFYIKRFKC